MERLVLAVSAAFAVFTSSSHFIVARAADREDCAKAVVLSGNSCEALSIRFDVSGCGDKPGDSKPQLTCSADSGEAVLVTHRSTYRLKLRLNEDGRTKETWWGALGKVEVVSHELSQATPAARPMKEFHALKKAVSKAPVLATEDDEAPEAEVPVKKKAN